MRSPQKTTVYLDAADYRRLQAVARRRGLKTAALVREAVSQYARGEGENLPTTLGAVRFDVRNLSERVNEHLEGLGADSVGEGARKRKRRS